MEQKYAYTLKEETDLVTWKEGLDKEALWSFVNDFMDHKITISLQYEKDRKKEEAKQKAIDTVSEEETTRLIQQAYTRERPE